MKKNEPKDLETEKIIEMNPITAKLPIFSKKHQQLTENIIQHHRKGKIQLPHDFVGSIHGIKITLDESLPPKKMKEEYYLTPDKRMQVLGVRVGKELYEELKNRFIKKGE